MPSKFGEMGVIISSGIILLYLKDAACATKKEDTKKIELNVEAGVDVPWNSCDGGFEKNVSKEQHTWGGVGVAG